MRMYPAIRQAIYHGQGKSPKRKKAPRVVIDLLYAQTPRMAIQSSTLRFCARAEIEEVRPG